MLPFIPLHLAQLRQYLKKKFRASRDFLWLIWRKDDLYFHQSLSALETCTETSYYTLAKLRTVRNECKSLSIRHDISFSDDKFWGIDIFCLTSFNRKCCPESSQCSILYSIEPIKLKLHIAYHFRSNWHESGILVLYEWTKSIPQNWASWEEITFH